MKESKEASDEDSKKKGTIISAMLTIDDIERIKKAFAEGKLKSYGVIGIEIPSEQELESAEKKWSKKELKSKGKKAHDETPPR